MHTARAISLTEKGHDMSVRKIDHICINVNDLEAAKAFFLDLGMVVQGEDELQGAWLEPLLGLTNVHTAVVYMQPPEGGANLELVKYYSPSDETGVEKAPANALGIRHFALVVKDIDAIVAKLKANGMEIFNEVYNYENIYKLCYVRGPENIIIELAEELT